MKAYSILTRFGHYFEVTGHDEDHARDEAEKAIAEGECPEDGDSIQDLEELPGLASCVQAIRNDLAEIMAR